MFLEMNAQYIQEDQVFAVTQDKRIQNVKVSPQAIRRGWMVHARGSKYLAEKDQRIQDLMMATQLAEQRQAQGIPSPVRDDKLWKMLLKEILGESGDVVKTDEEYAAEVAQYKAEQQALAMAEAEANGANAGDGAEGQRGPGQAPVGPGAGAP